MKQHQKRLKWRIAAFIIAGILLILLLANTILNSILPGKVRQALRGLPPTMQVGFSSIHGNLFTSSLSVTGVTVHYKPYSTQQQRQYAAFFSNISLSGVGIFKMLFSKKLVANTLTVDGGDIKLDSFLLAKKDSAQTIALPPIPISSVAINNFELKEANIWLVDSGKQHLLVKGNIALTAIKIADVNKPFTTGNVQFAGVEAMLSNMHCQVPGTNQNVQAKAVEISTKKELLQIDSLKIIPQQGSAAGTKLPENQLLAIEATIANITVHNLDVMKLADKKFVAEKISLSNINYSMPGANHIVQVKSIEMNTKEGLLQIEHLKIIPQYSKDAVAKMRGNQLPRVEASIENVTVLNLDFAKLADKKFIAKKVILHNPVTDVVTSASNTRRPSAIHSPAETSFEIKIDSFRIDNPSIIYAGQIEDGKPGKNAIAPMPFKTVSINHFAISNANISAKYNTVNTLHVKGDISIDDIVADSLNKHFGAIACNVENIDCTIPDAYSKLQIQKLVISSKKGSLQATGIKIIPQYGKLELGRMLSHQEDYIEATIASVQIVKFDVLKLQDKKLVADKIIIGESNIYAFRDRRLTRPLEPQPMPVASLKTLPFNIRVNTLQVYNSSIVYEEFPKDGVRTGTLSVDKLQVSISPLINHPLPTDPGHITMTVDGAIMGSGGVNAVINMPFSAEEDYTAKGTITNLDLTTLNSSAENLGKFHIESGLLNNLAFQFNFNEQKSTGSIVGVYHNIVVDKLKGNDKKIAWVPTFVVKHIIISKNKDASLPVARRTGKIDYTRDPTRYLSFYLLKSLLTGIKSSFYIWVFAAGIGGQGQ